MVDREFVSWVEPIARRDREGRAALLEFADTLPADTWNRQSPVKGWTCRDVLAHIAGDTGKWFAHMLHATLDGQQLDPTRVGPGVNVDALNKRAVEERKDSSITDLLAEIEADGEQHQELVRHVAERLQVSRALDEDLRQLVLPHVEEEVAEAEAEVVVVAEHLAVLEE